MKIFAVVFVVLMSAVITACTTGGEANGEANGGYEVAEPTPSPVPTPRSAARPTPTPAPIYFGNIFPPPEETPLPLSRPFEEFVFECGLMGFELTMYNPLGWHLWSGGGGVDEPLALLAWPDHLAEPRFQSLFFMLSYGSLHPSEWSARWNVPPETPGTALLRWQHPDEPANVFVTDTGITVVKYMQEGLSWLAFDEWVHNPDVVDMVFIFKKDGQNYRDTDGAQMFFSIIVSTSTEFYEEIMADVTDMLNGIRITDSHIRRDASATARALGITGENYPRIDGSTSANWLIRNIFGAMFDETYNGEPVQEWFWLGTSRTVPAYGLLIAEYVDLIITPNPSEHVLRQAENAGVELEFIPIGVEALVFITSADNPVSEITAEQLIDIYVHMTVTDWSELSGYEGRIVPFSRNPHSGSQALMDELVLAEHALHEVLTQYPYVIGGMRSMLEEVAQRHVPNEWRSVQYPNEFGLGYTVYFFLRQQYDNLGWYTQILNENPIKTLAVNGVLPSHETILSGEYPLSANYFAVIRADTPDGHPARLIAEWLLTPEGQAAVHEAGLGTLY